MFNAGSINNSRFNGVLSYSAKKTSSKKDRKGCKKEKIDSILKDKMVSACRLPVHVTEKKVTKHGYNSRINHGLKTNRKIDSLDSPDPYAFTDHEIHQAKRFSHEEYMNGHTSSYTPNHITNKLLNCGSIVRLSDNESGNKKTNEGKQSNLSNKIKSMSEYSHSRSNLVFNIPQNKSRVHSTALGDCKSGSQINVPISNILPDFGKSASKVVLPPKRKCKLSNWQKDHGTKHEALQRIQSVFEEKSKLKSDLFQLDLSSSEDDEDIICDDSIVVQQCILPTPSSLDRESRLTRIKYETCKKLRQVLQKIKSSNLDSQSFLSTIVSAAKTDPSRTAFLLNPQYNPVSKKNRTKECLMVKRICSLDSCNSKALPGARYCLKHIMYSVDQQLFTHCSGKLSDNTQCRMPVFDIKNISPLCLTHAQQGKDKAPVVNTPQVKKSKKKSKSLLSRHRGKKRRKVLYSDTNSSTSTSDVPENFMSPVPVVSSASSSMILRRGEEVFLTDASVPVNSSDLESNVSSHCELVQLEEVSEEVLASSRLLDDHEDLTTVLNQLPADAFNDLFSDKNGQYEPTREETEELERALEAVDKDVRCLERMTRTHIGIFDPVILPEDLNSQVFTGYPNGFSANPVALTNSTPRRL